MVWILDDVDVVVVNINYVVVVKLLDSEIIYMELVNKDFE